MKIRWKIFFWVFALLVIIYLLQKINFIEVWNLIKQANLIYFFLAFLTGAMSLFVFSIRSEYSLRKVVRIGYWFSFETTTINFFVNLITPGNNIGGEPVRAYFIGKKYKKPKAKILGALLADRFIHGAVSVFFIVVSLLFILNFIPITYELRIIFQSILFFLFFLATLVIFVNIRKKEVSLVKAFDRLRSLISKKRAVSDIKEESKLGKIFSKHLGNFEKTFKATIKNKKTVFVATTLSFIYWILNFLVSYFLFLSFNIKVSFFFVIMVISLANFFGDFSPSPGGIGLVEGTMTFAYSLLGINISLALAVSLLSRIISYFFSIVVGGLSLIHLEKTIR